MNKCKQCEKELTGKWTKKFCGKSCAAKYNNKEVRRHGKSPGLCLRCGNKTKTSARKFCGNKCSIIFTRGGNLTDEQRADKKRKRQREAFMRYYSRKMYQTPIDEDLSAIKLFYSNCPDGYEVDHIIPISKGGAHSIDNLQYLTVSENRKKNNKIMPL